MLKYKLIEEIKKKYSDVLIVGVSKYAGPEIVEDFRSAKIVDLGENRVDSFLEKYEKFEGIKWHFIGTLQTKKVKKIIDKIDYLHSLDRISLADEIQKQATKKVNCFVQVKTSFEESKQGVEVKELEKFLNILKEYDKIKIVGLMTMAPLGDDLKIKKECFTTLKNLKDRYNLEQLSMGMSSDYELAIEHGATIVRLGTLLYEKR